MLLLSLCAAVAVVAGMGCVAFIVVFCCVPFLFLLLLLLLLFYCCTVAGVDVDVFAVCYCC